MSKKSTPPVALPDMSQILALEGLKNLFVPAGAVTLTLDQAKTLKTHLWQLKDDVGGMQARLNEVVETLDECLDVLRTPSDDDAGEKTKLRANDDSGKKVQQRSNVRKSDKVSQGNPFAIR